MISIVDWRDAAAADVVPLVSLEAGTWLRQLHWDVADAWRVIEPARLAGQLPGALAIDQAGRPVGWTSFLLHGDSLQVMALVAPDEEVTSALVEAVLVSPEARKAESAIVCVRDASPGLGAVLVRHGFTVQPYRYLRASLAGIPESRDTFEPWPSSVGEVAELFRRAYADEHTVRAFAPDGRLEQWTEYVSQLEKGPGCGWFQPELSPTSRRSAGAPLDAALLVTSLGPGTVHIAQLAVDPRARRRGLARRLVCSALGKAKSTNDRATLLVSSANAGARALYTSLGFAEITEFVVATRRQPILSTSRAPSSGGARTRL